MIVRADKEIIETRKSHRNLTEKIHKHWQPENYNLNTGTFQRGKKPPGVPSTDSWLTFNGAQGEESQGLVDAFAGRSIFSLRILFALNLDSFAHADSVEPRVD